jgi:hypothetical protein
MKLLKKPDGNISEKEFYVRNLTWGLPVNIGGAIISLGMLATGHKPQKYGNCVQFEVGKNWGGGSLGLFMFTCKDAPDSLKSHEHGHSVQNCFYGPLMPFIVNLPSSARFMYRMAVSRLNPNKKLEPYDNAWFEGEATELGKKYLKDCNRH